MAPRVRQRDSRSTDVHNRDLQDMAQGGRSMVSVTRKEKRCSARGDPYKRLRSATVVQVSSMGILARDADLKAVRFLLRVNLLDALSSARVLSGFRRDVVESTMEETGATRSQLKQLNPGMEDAWLNLESFFELPFMATISMKIGEYPLSHVGVGFSKGSTNRDFLKEAQSRSAEVYATRLVASEEGCLGFGNSGPGRIESWI
ncbi:hypothetical protein NE237_014528 [Protea cynaroides]|uniref:Uncharacterized protein n=1 Tax=Protea cynaroides TaxID=273540 RepID=A0A9Q0QQ66_9MAGN|nr:hypothetical protein NE237_014528 [Protea cynaroides]